MLNQQIVKMEASVLLVSPQSEDGWRFARPMYGARCAFFGVLPRQAKQTSFVGCLGTRVLVSSGYLYIGTSLIWHIETSLIYGQIGDLVQYRHRFRVLPKTAEDSEGVAPSFFSHFSFEVVSVLLHNRFSFSLVWSCHHLLMTSRHGSC